MLLYPGIEKANKQTNKQPTNYDKKQIIKITENTNLRTAKLW
jgi:hypothetical protein